MFSAWVSAGGLRGVWLWHSLVCTLDQLRVPLWASVSSPAKRAGTRSEQGCGEEGAPLAKGIRCSASPVLSPSAPQARTLCSPASVSSAPQAPSSVVGSLALGSHGQAGTALLCRLLGAPRPGPDRRMERWPVARRVPACPPAGTGPVPARGHHRPELFLYVLAKGQIT